MSRPDQCSGQITWAVDGYGRCTVICLECKQVFAENLMPGEAWLKKTEVVGQGHTK